MADREGYRQLEAGQRPQDTRVDKKLQRRALAAYSMLLVCMGLYFVNHFVAVGGVVIGFLRHRRCMWSAAMDFPLIAQATINGLILFSFIFIYSLYDTTRPAQRKKKGSGDGSACCGCSLVGLFLRFTGWLGVRWRGGFVPKMLGVAMIAKLVCDNLVVSMTTMGGEDVMTSNNHHIACRYESDYLHFLDRVLPTQLAYDFANFTSDPVWEHDITVEQACNAKVMNRSIKAVDKSWCRTYLAGIEQMKFDIICMLPAILQAIVIGHEVAEYPPYGQVWKDFTGCVTGNGCELTYTFALDFILTRTGATRAITVRNRGSKRDSDKYFLHPDETKISNTDYRDYWMSHSTQWINTHAIKEEETKRYILLNAFNASNQSADKYLELDAKLDNAQENLDAAREKRKKAETEKEAMRLAQKKSQPANTTKNHTEANSSAEKKAGFGVSAAKTTVKQLEASQKEIREELKKKMGEKLPKHWEKYLANDNDMHTLNYDRTGEMVLMKLWASIVDVMTAPGAPGASTDAGTGANISDYQFDKCEYKCGQILAPSMKMTDLIDQLPSILAGGTIINEFSRSVVPWLLGLANVGRTPVFVTRDTEPEELMRILKLMQRDDPDIAKIKIEEGESTPASPRSPRTAAQIVVLAAVAVFTLPGCIDILACNAHTQLNWLVGIGAKCLLVATALVIMQLMSIFRYVPFPRVLWNEGEDEFLVMNDEHEMEPKTVKLVEWVQMSASEQFGMLVYKARGISETEVDKAIKSLQEVKKQVEEKLPVDELLKECVGKEEDGAAKARGLLSLMQLNKYSSLLSSLIEQSSGEKKRGEPGTVCLRRSLSKKALSDKLHNIKAGMGDPDDEEEQAKTPQGSMVLIPLVVTFVLKRSVLADRYVAHDKLQKNQLDKKHDAYPDETQILKKRAFAEELELCGDQHLFGFVISRSATPGKVVVLLQARDVHQESDHSKHEFWIADVAIANLIDASAKWHKPSVAAIQMKLENAKEASLRKQIQQKMKDDKHHDYLLNKGEEEKRRLSKVKQENESCWSQIKCILPDLVFLEWPGVVFFRYFIPLLIFSISFLSKVRMARNDLAQQAQNAGTDLHSDWASFGRALLGTINPEELPTFLTIGVLLLHQAIDLLICLVHHADPDDPSQSAAE